MSRVIAGFLAGTVATAVVSILMVLEMTLGPATQMGFIDALVEGSARHLGIERNPVVGWVVHLVIGIFVWGGLYGLINPQGSGTTLSRGLQFGLFVWLLMMTLLMPLAGKGLFGLAEGVFFMGSALVYHLIYGVILAHQHSRMLEPVRVVPRERMKQEGSSAHWRRRIPH